MKHKYSVNHYDTNQEFENALNLLCNSGWELVNVFIVSKEGYSDGIRAIFRCER